MSLCGSFLETLALRPLPRSLLILCALAGCALQFPLAELSNQLQAHLLGPRDLAQQQAIEALLTASNPFDFMVLLTCLALLVPLSEEFLFRGFLLFGLAERYGPSRAIGLSALLFGLCHMDPATVVYASLAGLVLGWLAWRCQSIWPSVALHAGVNSMPVLLGPSIFPMEGFNVTSDEVQHLPVAVFVPSLGIALLLLAAVAKRTGAVGEKGRNSDL